MERKTIGILGGIGPLATADLFLRITRRTPAEKDQEHIKVIVNSDPQIPDRTAYILGKGESPLPRLIEAARKLELWGADFITMPCNTAHFFAEEIQRHLSVPLLNMIEITGDYLASRGFKQLALLATTGTIKARVYGAALERRGVKIVYPSDEDQDLVMRAIYQGVKRGDLPLGKRLLTDVAERLSVDSEGIIAGCTEVSTAITNKMVGISRPIVDPLDLLAQKAVQRALGS